MKPYLIGLLILTVAVACSQETNKTGEYLNPGESIKVKPGQIFTISMESNPATGYNWQLSKELDSIIILITNAYIPADSKLGGHEVWTFKAIDYGQTNILMKYVRPCENDQPARTNVFTVIVN